MSEQVISRRRPKSPPRWLLLVFSDRRRRRVPRPSRAQRPGQFMVQSPREPTQKSDIRPVLTSSSIARPRQRSRSPTREHRDQARSLALRAARYDEPRSLDRGEQALCRSAQAAPIYKKIKPLEPEESAIRPEAGSVYSLTGAGAINCSRNLSQASTRKPNLVISTWSLSALLCFTDLSQTSLPSQRCTTAWSRIQASATGSSIMSTIAPRDGPSLQPDQGVDMKTRLENHTCKRAATASGRLSRYFIRY
jgi:hypothetical protein